MNTCIKCGSICITSGIMEGMNKKNKWFLCMECGSQWEIFNGNIQLNSTFDFNDYKKYMKNKGKLS